MLDHISLSVSDLARSIAFYDAVLAPLGCTRVWSDSEAAGYGYPGQDDNFAIKREPSTAVAVIRRLHIAFAALLGKPSSNSMPPQFGKALSLTGRRNCIRPMAKTILPPSSAIRTAIGSKPFAMSEIERVRRAGATGLFHFTAEALIASAPKSNRSVAVTNVRVRSRRASRAISKSPPINSIVSRP